MSSTAASGSGNGLSSENLTASSIAARISASIFCHASSVRSLCSHQACGKAADGVSLLPFFDFFLRTWILLPRSFGMSAPTIGLAFDESRTLTGTRTTNRGFGSFVDSHHIVAIDNHPRNTVARQHGLPRR